MAEQLDDVNKSQMVKLFWALIIFFNLILVAMVGSHLVDVHTFYDLKSNGVLVEAKVTGLASRKKQKGVTIDTLHYEFRDGESKLVKGKEDIIFVSAKVGDKIKVQYLAGKPQVSRVVGNYFLASMTLLLVVLAVIVLMANRYALKIKDNPDLLFKKKD